MIQDKMEQWLLRVFAMMKKEYLQLFRDIPLFLFMVYAFTADIYNSANAISLQLKNAKTLIEDQDKTRLSREIAYLFKPPYFDVEYHEISKKRDKYPLEYGDAMLVFQIPSGFEKNLLRGENASIQMLVDAGYSIPGFLASSYTTTMVLQKGLELSAKSYGISGFESSFPLIKDEYKTLYNENQNEKWFMSVTQVMNIVTVFAVLLTATSLVREKEKGTIEQLIVSPLSPSQILIPKILATSSVIMIGILISWIFIIRGIFDFVPNGSFLFFWFICALYVICVSGLGIFIAGFANNMGQMGMLTVLVVAPMIFLSGAWTPPEAMPKWLSMGMSLLPLKYFIDAGYEILFKGSGWSVVWKPTAIIVIFGLIYFYLGIKNFKRSIV